MYLTLLGPVLSGVRKKLTACNAVAKPRKQTYTHKYPARGAAVVQEVQ